MLQSAGRLGRPRAVGWGRTHAHTRRWRGATSPTASTTPVAEPLTRLWWLSISPVIRPFDYTYHGDQDDCALSSSYAHPCSSTAKKGAVHVRRRLQHRCRPRTTGRSSMADAAPSDAAPTAARPHQQRRVVLFPVADSDLSEVGGGRGGAAADAVCLRASLGLCQAGALCRRPPPAASAARQPLRVRRRCLHTRWSTSCSRGTRCTCCT